MTDFIIQSIQWFASHIPRIMYSFIFVFSSVHISRSTLVQAYIYHHLVITNSMKYMYKNNKSLQRFAVLLLAGILSISYQANAAGNKKVWVGAAAATVNPGLDNFIAGDKGNRHFAGIHDSLYVKAVVVSDAKNSIILVTVDCIGIIYPTLLEIRTAAAAQIPEEGFDASNIVLTSTHTHSGPDVVGLWGENQASSGVKNDYIQKLVATAATTIAKAWKNKRPATIHYAEASYGEGWVYNISKPKQLDRSLTILQCTDLNGKAIATVSNFACHPTIMDAATDLVSADYVGGFYAELDKRLTGVNLFLQGSIGGWVQPEHEQKTFANAARIGKALADTVIGSLKHRKTLDSTTIQFKRKLFALPVSNPGFRQLASLGVINRTITDSVQTEIAWFGIGNARFVTHPGETSPIYSIESKKLMKTTGPKFVLGLGLDGLGYSVTPDFFDLSNKIPNAEYLTGMSIDKNAGTVVMRIITELSGEK